MHAQEVNPDEDVMPEQTEKGCRVWSDGEKARVYHTDGKCLGTITHGRMLWLRANFAAAKRRTALVRKLEPKTFEEEVALLLIRYRTGAKKVGGKVNMQNHWSTPGVLLGALCDMFSIRTERFASPLNHDMRIPRYYSAHPRDVLFGAEIDAFSSRVVGSNYMNPEYEGPDLYKALRHAMQETSGDAPVCTVLVYPRWTEYRYMALLCAPCVHLLCKLENFRFNPPDYFADAGRSAGEAGWPVLVLVVANDAGLREFARPDLQALRAAVDAIGAKAKWMEPPGGRRSPKDQPGEFVPFANPQTYYRDLRYDPNLAPDVRPADWAEAHESADGDWTWLRSMRAPRGTIYTDGSKTETGDGAAIYDSATECTHYLPVPGAGPAVVLRAELTALWQTLVRYRYEPLRVLTDSLNSLLLIRRIMDRPHTVRGHEAEPLLEAIRAEVERRHAPVELCKVLAHVGYHGNEMADTGAKAVANGDEEGELVGEVRAQPTTEAVGPFVKTADGPAPVTDYAKQLGDKPLRQFLLRRKHTVIAKMWASDAKRPWADCTTTSPTRGGRIRESTRTTSATYADCATTASSAARGVPSGMGTRRGAWHAETTGTAGHTRSSGADMSPCGGP